MDWYVRGGSADTESAAVTSGICWSQTAKPGCHWFAPVPRLARTRLCEWIRQQFGSCITRVTWKGVTWKAVLQQCGWGKPEVIGWAGEQQTVSGWTQMGRCNDWDGAAVERC